jgi:signal transduction histidine kinase
MAQNRNIKIKAESDNSLPKIMGNRDEMGRVMDNLISNAIKYSPEGSDVVVKVFKTNNSQYNFDKFPMIRIWFVQVL